MHSKILDKLKADSPNYCLQGTWYSLNSAKVNSAEIFLFKRQSLLSQNFPPPEKGKSVLFHGVCGLNQWSFLGAKEVRFYPCNCNAMGL
jgi:hypothetical protein